MFHKIAALGIVAVSMLACAQSPTTDHAAIAPAPVRVIVQFHQATAFQDEGFLTRLQTRVQARIRFLATVSNDTVVYSVQPDSGQTMAQLVQCLRHLPEIVRVDLDTKAQAQ